MLFKSHTLFFRGKPKRYPFSIYTQHKLTRFIIVFFLRRMKSFIKHIYHIIVQSNMLFFEIYKALINIKYKLFYMPLNLNLH